MTRLPSCQCESAVSPLDELRILYEYAGTTNVSRLYERMEELGEQLGYGREYWKAIVRRGPE